MKLVRCALVVRRLVALGNCSLNYGIWICFGVGIFLAPQAGLASASASRGAREFAAARAAPQSSLLLFVPSP
eukprot:1512984-Pyramimonas_sp.AAC.1